MPLLVRDDILNNKPFFWERVSVMLPSTMPMSLQTMIPPVNNMTSCENRTQQRCGGEISNATVDDYDIEDAMPSMLLPTTTLMMTYS